MIKSVIVSDLKVGDVLAESIKSEDGKDLVTKGYVLTESIIKSLRRRGKNIPCTIISNDNQKERLNKGNISKEKVESTVSSKTKYIYYASGIELKQAIEELEACASFLCDDLKTIEDLSENCTKINYANNQEGHYYRLTRMAIILANLYNKEMSQNKPISLESISMASLLHDYGKRYKNDSSSLSRLLADTETIKKLKIRPDMLGDTYDNRFNSIYAYIALKDKVSEDVRKAILYCGSTNPNALEESGKDSSKVAASIITICDIYDTLLEYVITHNVQNPFENVISCMRQLAHNNKINKDLFKLFLKHIPIYTRGVKVLLSNGELAIVVENNPEDPTRPAVLTLTPGNVKAINLSKTTNITIEGIVGNDTVTNKVDSITNEQLKDINEDEVEDFIPETIVLQQENSTTLKKK